MMAATSTSQGSVVEFALALVAVWVAAAACAFCLNALGDASSVVVAAATAPLIVAFLIRGADLTLWLAALMTVAACFVIRMLGENFRMFAEIVRSRFAIAEKQRDAENARQAAMTIALTDDLTALPNRRSFQGQLADRITTGTGTACPFAVGLIDLDGFKPINDIHGHPAGDDILRQVSFSRLSPWRRAGSAASICLRTGTAPRSGRSLRRRSFRSPGRSAPEVVSQATMTGLVRRDSIQATGRLCREWRARSDAPIFRQP